VVGVPNVVDGPGGTDSGVALTAGSGDVVDDTSVATTVFDGRAAVDRGALPDSMAGDAHAPATRARLNQSDPCRAVTLTYCPLDYPDRCQVSRVASLVA
jgi:hypothetical protein